MPEEVLRLDDVSVSYRRVWERASLKERLAGRTTRARDHLALDGVDLALARGEAVGIIGMNGAGKSTLLRVAARILQPASGRVRIRGRVAPLLDLIGAFHPELTGRENVYLQCALHSFTRREIAERFDEIIAFAEIGDFLDAPLRTYSSGMMLRLAFAILSSIDADILLVDEALGVGDAGFQEKCASRMRAMRDRGLAFLIVSHDLTRIREMCDRVVWLHSGRVRAMGNAADVVARYIDSVVSR
ncbi:MAG TPA: ABC transporter ATP-binding protein [Thermoanaerobaculia bacterium]|nr:ABC transporter ATP-binding protein [Thermoanaerobaculia bacterium]